MEPLGEALDFLLEGDDLTLLVVDQGQQVWLGQPLEIGDDGQRPSLSPGLIGTVGRVGMECKANLLRELNRYALTTDSRATEVVGGSVFFYPTNYVNLKSLTK